MSRRRAVVLRYKDKDNNTKYIKEERINKYDTFLILREINKLSNNKEMDINKINFIRKIVYKMLNWYNNLNTVIKNIDKIELSFGSNYKVNFSLCIDKSPVIKSLHEIELIYTDTYLLENNLLNLNFNINDNCKSLFEKECKKYEHKYYKEMISYNNSNDYSRIRKETKIRFAKVKKNNKEVIVINIGSKNVMVLEQDDNFKYEFTVKTYHLRDLEIKGTHILDKNQVINTIKYENKDETWYNEYTEMIKQYLNFLYYKPTDKINVRKGVRRYYMNQCLNGFYINRFIMYNDRILASGIDTETNLTCLKKINEIMM